MPDTEQRLPPHPELQAYQQRNRRQLAIYGAGLVLLVVLGFGLVRLAYARGEINKVDKASASAATAVPSAPPASTLNLKWRSDDRPAGGTAYEDGIVVTYDQHSVNGREALTGALRWHYSRSDQTLCGVVQQDHTTIAVYNRHGNCDEATGFVTGTGEPKWYRTLTDNGTDAISSAPNVVLLVTDHAVHVIDNAGGLDRWVFSPDIGCTVDRALGGSRGVLISFHCGNKSWLALHDLIGDTVKWKVAVNTRQVPITADAFIAAIDPLTGIITEYNEAKGTAGSQLPAVPSTDLAQSVAALPRSQTTSTLTGTTAAAAAPSGELVHLGSNLFLLDATKKVLWTVSTSSPGRQVSDTLIGATDQSGIVLIKLTDGTIARTVAVPGAAGTEPIPLGRGFLLAGTSTAVVQ